jgi:hypothetical protein
MTPYRTMSATGSAYTLDLTEAIRRAHEAATAGLEEVRGTNTLRPYAVDVTVDVVLAGIANPRTEYRVTVVVTSEIVAWRVPEVDQ